MTIITRDAISTVRGRSAGTGGAGAGLSGFDPA